MYKCPVYVRVGAFYFHRAGRNHLQKKKFLIFGKVSFFPWNFQPAVHRPDSKLLFLFVNSLKKKNNTAFLIKITPTQHAWKLFFFMLSLPSVCVAFIITRRQLLNINNNKETLAEAGSKDPCAGCSMAFLATNASSWLLFLRPHPPAATPWKCPALARGCSSCTRHPRAAARGERGSGREVYSFFSFL